MDPFRRGAGIREITGSAGEERGDSRRAVGRRSGAGRAGARRTTRTYCATPGQHPPGPRARRGSRDLMVSLSSDDPERVIGAVATTRTDRQRPAPVR
ncbi:hypothetical protein ACFPM0_23395 [Pseudonocardia sulfidoxydans]|uniref:hypothetical protein n=1 Tax=Pseudonocardia sulfidoxydans TaxID=54011 RepID=UPI00361C2EF4